MLKFVNLCLLNVKYMYFVIYLFNNYINFGIGFFVDYFWVFLF